VLISSCGCKPFGAWKDGYSLLGTDISSHVCGSVTKPKTWYLKEEGNPHELVKQYLNFRFNFQHTETVS
jgi:hypothetical protein